MCFILDTFIILAGAYSTGEHLYLGNNYIVFNISVQCMNVKCRVKGSVLVTRRWWAYSKNDELVCSVFISSIIKSRALHNKGSAFLAALSYAAIVRLLFSCHMMGLIRSIKRGSCKTFVSARHSQTTSPRPDNTNNAYPEINSKFPYQYARDDLLHLSKIDYCHILGA